MVKDPLQEPIEMDATIECVKSCRNQLGWMQQLNECEVMQEPIEMDATIV